MSFSKVNNGYFFELVSNWWYHNGVNQSLYENQNKPQGNQSDCEFWHHWPLSFKKKKTQTTEENVTLAEYVGAGFTDWLTKQQQCFLCNTLQTVTSFQGLVRSYNNFHCGTNTNGAPLKAQRWSSTIDG